MKETGGSTATIDNMNRILTFIPAILFLAVFLSCDREEKSNDSTVRKVDLSPPAGRAVAAFASGCFWCSEHIFEAVPGVDSAVSGYAGGSVPNPTYELVNTETTGHAETVLVYYNPDTVTFEELTHVFFTSHDPTTPDRQGPDVGSSYRSILFYQTEEEKEIAEDAIRTFSASFENPIVTETKKLTQFFRAEGYHQDYIHHNPNSPYVRGVSIPRYEQFKKTYKGKLKPDA
jgi:peptide-methionine (S)-S-oxide reductase